MYGLYRDYITLSPTKNPILMDSGTCLASGLSPGRIQVNVTKGLGLPQLPKLKTLAYDSYESNRYCCRC